MKSLDRQSLTLIHGNILDDKTGLKAIDNDISTFWHSSSDDRYMKPFLLVDFKKQHTISGIIAIRRETASRKWLKTQKLSNLISGVFKKQIQITKIYMSPSKTSGIRCIYQMQIFAMRIKTIF